jgi:hypothetical protein
MIYKYSIENFYSIKDKVEINLVSRKSEPKAEELYRDVPFDKKVSKVIFVGGSNASGKTNILRALPFLQMMFTYVDYSDDDAGYRPFLLGLNIRPSYLWNFLLTMTACSTILFA